jgi:very-short-patch-repair endonuclease
MGSDMSLFGRERAVQYARELRRRQTSAEKILWNALRNRRLLGKKFLRQHPIFTDPSNNDVFYVADFYCHEARLVIELDGKVHEFRLAYDKRRTEVMEFERLRVLRFKNEEVEEELQCVLEKIAEALSQPPTPFSRREKGAQGDESMY